MPLHVILARDYDHMGEVAAEFACERIARTLAACNACVLGLPTGRSPVGVYRWLARFANDGRFDTSRIRTFNLDEYVGLPGTDARERARHPASFQSFMERHLFSRLQMKFAETWVPGGCWIDQNLLEAELRAHPVDWREQGADDGKAIVIRRGAESDYLRWLRREILEAYERKIMQSGGIDLQIIGVGGHGHVAFHEAGIPFDGNRMLLVKLDRNTIANAVADGHFARKEDSPRYAISMGAELVYQARCVILLASGPRKAGPIAASLAENPTPAVPVSYSQLYAQRGGEMLYVVDRAAAAGIFARRAEIEKRGGVIEDISGPSPPAAGKT